MQRLNYQIFNDTIYRAIVCLDKQERGRSVELSELTAYAGEKYRIQEQHRWAEFPGFSVLCHPQTGKWVALLMRQWDSETGREIERCDLKCGSDSLVYDPRPYLAPPLRMHGSRWLSIAFDERTEREVIFRLFDKAIRTNASQGCTIVLGTASPVGESAYRDTALPFAESGYQPPRERVPERLRELRRLFSYGRESPEEKAKSFYRQALFMADYEDDYPWSGNLMSYYPSYQDLNTQQLRGYFSWRSQARKGVFQPISASAAYLYVYELLNGVGVASPEEGLGRLRELEAGFLDTGIGDRRMGPNLRRWMLEYAVLNDLPRELALQAAEPEMLARDQALAVLKEPEGQEDEAVFAALCTLGGKKTADSPVLRPDPERGRRLFSEVWRLASAYRWQDTGLFALCFGEPWKRRWYPLANALYYERNLRKTGDYVLDECRSYHCSYGVWQVTAYEKTSFDRQRLQGFLHETDARLRRYLKTGRYLRENPADAWAVPYIDAAIQADRDAVMEAAKPKITIDLSGLEQIRRDAVRTRDSLLTEEEREEQEEPLVEEREEPPAAEPETTDLPLDGVQVQILRALLEGEDPAPILKARHRMASVTADLINESLFDEIGDTVLECDNDRLSLVEDYIEDIARLLGGSKHG